MYGLTMVIIGLALMLSKVLMADNVDVCDTSVSAPQGNTVKYPNYKLFCLICE